MFGLVLRWHEPCAEASPLAHRNTDFDAAINPGRAMT